MKKALYTLLLSAIIAPGVYGQSTIALRSGNVTPAPTSMSELRYTANEVVNGIYYRFIQFRQIPTEAEKLQLEKAGIQLYNYLPHNTYMAAIAANTDLKLISSENIFSVFPIEPMHKLDKFLATGDYPEWAVAGKNKIEVVATHHPGINHNIAGEMLAGEGFVTIHSLPDINAYRLIVSKADIQRLAALPYLYFLEVTDGEPVAENLPGRTSHRSNTLATEYAGGLKFDGKGVSVALNDDGAIGPHIDYTGRIIDQYISFNNGDHGDHCAGILFGAGNRNPTTRGMASGANLGVYGVGPFPTAYQAFDSINNHYNSKNIRITSTSYGNGNNAGYTTLARLMDVQSNSMHELLHVFSAGNSGTSNFGYGAGAGWGNITGGHKQAKNVLTVANLDNVDALSNSSSRGPAYDGRIKPDIAAVGSNVNSTIEPNTYDVFSGTSMACPAIAGISAQLYQAYKEHNAGQNPKAALIKAILLNTTDDLGNAGPDFRFGWGRVNTRRAYNLLSAQQYKQDTVAHNATDANTITVPANVAELRVMVYWQDYEATANAAKALVNNLDLAVINPASQTTLPWVLNPTPNATILNQAAVRGTDTLNNMEQVTIANPAAGSYTVNVTGTSVPQGPQTYYLVYEFVTTEPVLTYPIGGESLVPGVAEFIRWDAYGNNGTFTLEYSTDNGANWINIANNISASLRHYSWTPPAVVTGLAKIRVTRNSQSSQSQDNFSIIGIPSNLTVNWVCIDSMRVTYNTVSGAAGYIVSVLGAEYMDSAGYSTTGSCVVKNIDTRNGGWFSVQAVPANGGKGRRANAVTFNTVPFNCTAPEDIALTAFTTPSLTGQLNCLQPQITDTVKIVLRNNSFSTLSSAAVKYTLNNGTPVPATFTGALGIGYSDTITFAAPITIAAAGNYDLKAWHEIAPGTQNMIAATDTITMQKTVTMQAPISQPVQELFSTTALCSTTDDCGITTCPLPNNWVNVANNMDGIDWRAHAGPTPTRSQNGQTGPAQGTAGPTDVYLYLEASQCQGQEAHLVSPCITLKSPNAALQFSYHMFGTNSGELHIDVNDGTGWINDIHPAITGDKGDGWKTPGIILLNSYINKTINLRFRGITGNGENSDIAIDNIQVFSYGNVSEQSSTQLFNVYPNPGNGIYSISAQGITGSAAITVTDISGKVIKRSVATADGGAINSNISLADNAPGVYIMHITNGTNTQNIKLVKL